MQEQSLNLLLMDICNNSLYLQAVHF